MLGREIFDLLNQSDHEVVGSYRSARPAIGGKWEHFDTEFNDLNQFFNKIGTPDIIINCIGLIPQKMKSVESINLRKMITVNSIFPNRLRSQQAEMKFKLIQITTDCVFSGVDGNYSEVSPHDATDIYGITKSVGEIAGDGILQLRCSIIGRRDYSNVSLNNWLVSQKQGAKVQGYSNHFWNGITTNAFAKIVMELLLPQHFFTGTYHLVPRDSLTKEELLNKISVHSGRNDIKVEPYATLQTVDRRLTTIYPGVNASLWRLAGYPEVPTIESLIEEMYNGPDPLTNR